MAKSNLTVEQRFWNRVDKSGSSGCWNWMGHIQKGYGYFYNGTRMATVHRFSWVLANGPILNGPGYHGYCVCHRCDNRKCVNPSHLFLGTAQENSNDQKSKGHTTRGERSSTARLSEAQVIEIRRLSNQGLSRAELARRYGITPQSMSALVRGKNWAYLLEAGQ